NQEISAFVNPDEVNRLDLIASGLPDATGEIVLTGGKYKIGATRGALVTPQFFPKNGRAVPAGPNADFLAFQCGFATNGVTPDTLSNVRFAFGPIYSQVIPGSSFVKKGDKFTFTSKTGKSKFTITIDFGAEV